MTQLIEYRVQQGRDAHRRHAWHEAFDWLREADSESTRRSRRPLATGGVRLVCWGSRCRDRGTGARARRISGAGRKMPRAELAVELAVDHFERLETAIGSGWLGRAKRLLEQTPDECAAHGWQAITLAYLAIRLTGDWDEALSQAKLAHEIGERLDRPAIQALALQQQGYALVSMGRVDEGLALIDESTVAAVSGELDPLTTGRIYCSTISVCRNLADWRRALEWTDAAERWCKRQGVSGFPGICRVHRAEIMDFRGSWADAEREAKRACEELSRYDLMFSGEAQYEIGEVRLRVGDTGRRPGGFPAGPRAQPLPEPGMSLLRLAKGTLRCQHLYQAGARRRRIAVRSFKRDCSPLPSRSGSLLETSTPLHSTSQSSSRSPVLFGRQQ